LVFLELIALFACVDIDIVFTGMETRDSMSEAEQPLRPSVPHRVFYGPLELPAGWRLFIFLAIVSAMIITTNRVVRSVLPGADATTLFCLPSDQFPA